MAGGRGRRRRHPRATGGAAPTAVASNELVQAVVDAIGEHLLRMERHDDVHLVLNAGDAVVAKVLLHVPDSVVFAVGDVDLLRVARTSKPRKRRVSGVADCARHPSLLFREAMCKPFVARGMRDRGSQASASDAASSWTCRRRPRHRSLAATWPGYSTGPLRAERCCGLPSRYKFAAVMGVSLLEPPPPPPPRARLSRCFSQRPEPPVLSPRCLGAAGSF